MKLLFRLFNHYILFLETSQIVLHIAITVPLSE